MSDLEKKSGFIQKNYTNEILEYSWAFYALLEV